MRNIFSKLSFIGLTLAVALAGNGLFGAGSAHAYSNNNMIDNAVFDNTNSMSTAQIQSFLNQFPNSCIKNYQAPDPITDLNNWSHYGALVPASQVIKDAATRWGINPQVILTTLQKEEQLIDGSQGCANWKLWSAMGYNCPSSTTYTYTVADLTAAPINYAGGLPADMSSGAGPTCANKAQGVGFSAQVYHGAWQLEFGRQRSEGDGNLNWDTDNYVQYYGYMTAGTRARYQGGSTATYSGNITLSDGANVTLANGATASLYSYTPYIQSFDSIFSGWFGPPNGTPIVQVPGDPTEYLVWGGYYYPIPSGTVLNAWGFGSTPITQTSSSYFTSLKQGPRLSTLARFGSDPTAYLIDGNIAHGFPNGTVYSDYGYSYGVSETIFDTTLQGAIASGTVAASIIRTPDSAAYIMKGGRKSLFPDYQTFNTLGSPVYSSQPSVNLSFAYASQLPDGAPLLLDGKVVRQSDGSTIYLYDSGKLYTFSPQSYQAWGGGLDYSFESPSLSQFPAPNPAPTLVSNSAGTRYMVDSGAKLQINSDVQSAWGYPDSSFAITMSAPSLSRLRNEGLSTVIQGSTVAVYLIQGGKRHVFPSEADFKTYGFSSGSISPISDSAMSQLPLDVPAYGPGSLLRTSDGTIYWIDLSFQAITIPSIAIFNTFGFSSTASIRSIDTALASTLTPGGTLTNLLTTPDGTYFLIDSTKKMKVSSSAYSSTQFNFGAHAVNAVSNALAQTIANGPDLTQYVQGSEQTVYMVNNGQKQPFSTATSFFAHGGAWSAVTRLSDEFINSLPTGSGL